MLLKIVVKVIEIVILEFQRNALAVEAFFDPATQFSEL
jgi:hypothetical protein